MSPECRRAQEWVSRDVDGELSTFEQTLLNRHVDECADCRTFRGDVLALTHTLRSAELELPEQRVVVSWRQSRRRLRMAPVAAALAVAAVGLGSVLGSFALPGSFESTPPPARNVGGFNRLVNLEKLSSLRTTRPRRANTGGAPEVPVHGGVASSQLTHTP